MICMRKFSEHEMAFLNAVSLLVERDWKGRKGSFADVAGISGGYLSEIIGKKKCPKIDKQENIAKKLGYDSLMSFVEYGKTIKQEDMINVIPKAKIKPTTPAPPRAKTDIEIQIDKNHQELVGRFTDKETALKINQLLVRLEELENGDGLKAALEWAEYRVHQAEKKRGLLGNGTEGG